MITFLKKQKKIEINFGFHRASNQGPLIPKPAALPIELTGLVVTKWLIFPPKCKDQEIATVTMFTWHVLSPIPGVGLQADLSQCQILGCIEAFSHISKSDISSWESFKCLVRKCVKMFLSGFFFSHAPPGIEITNIGMHRNIFTHLKIWHLQQGIFYKKLHPVIMST